MNGQVTEPLSPGKQTARVVLSVAKGIMKRMGRLYQYRVTALPRSVPGGHIASLVSELPNGRGDLVGESRVRVFVPDDRRLSIRVALEWTRDAFGFWYRNEFVLQNVDDPSAEMSNRFEEAMRPVRQTADGTVPVNSMNLLYHKVKKSRARDQAAKSGLVMG